MKTYDDIFKDTIKPKGLIHVTGPSGVGKSLFSVGLIEVGMDPKRIAVFDGEQSLSGHHASLGFGAYFDLISMFTEQHGLFAEPRMFFTMVRELATTLDPDDFDVIVFDNIRKLESSFRDEVEAHPHKFGLTVNQIERGGGLKWGPIKQLYSSFIQSLARIANIYIFTSHLSQVWMGSAPIPGLYRPVGKQDILERQTFLRVWLLHNPSSKYPDGLKLKDRLTIPDVTEDGITWRPVLPPKLSPCNWAHILEYMKEPPDLDNLKPAERLTMEDWAKLRGTLTADQLKIVELQAKESEKEEEIDTMTQAEFLSAIKKDFNLNLDEALEKLNKDSLDDVVPNRDYRLLRSIVMSESKEG